MWSPAALSLLALIYAGIPRPAAGFNCFHCAYNHTSDMDIEFKEGSITTTSCGCSKKQDQKGNAECYHDNATLTYDACFGAYGTTKAATGDFLFRYGINLGSNNLSKPTAGCTPYPEYNLPPGWDVKLKVVCICFSDGCNDAPFDEYERASKNSSNWTATTYNPGDGAVQTKGLLLLDVLALAISFLSPPSLDKLFHRLPM